MLSYTDLYITVSFLLASKTGILSVWIIYFNILGVDCINKNCFFLIVKYFLVLTQHLLSFQFDENRTIRSRYESSLRASLRVTKYLENWNVDKPFATLHVSPMATKLLSVTVSNHGNLWSKDIDPYKVYYCYIIYILWYGDICVLYRLELILPTLNLSVEVIKVVLGWKGLLEFTLSLYLQMEIELF